MKLSRRTEDAGPQRAPERRSSQLFESQAARSNQILATTLYNELIRSGRGVSEILDFVNCLLGLVTGAGPRGGPLMLDSATGFPTRAGLLELLKHELDPQRQEQPESALMMVVIPDIADSLVLAGLVSQQLRGRDVIVPLDEGRIAAVVYCPHGSLASLADRVRGGLQRRLSEVQARPRLELEPLSPGGNGRAVLRELFRRLKER